MGFVFCVVEEGWVVRDMTLMLRVEYDHTREVLSSGRQGRACDRGAIWGETVSRKLRNSVAGA